MKKTFLFSILVALSLGCLAQEPHYDFSVHVTGKPYYLYYKIIDSVNLQVEMTYPCLYDGDYWYDCNKPSGKMVIPERVYHNQTYYSVVGISDHAFYNCDEISDLQLTKQVLSIGSEAFKGCMGINVINSPLNPPPTASDDTFEEVPETTVVYVSYNATEPYHNAPGWSRFTVNVKEKSFWSGNAEPWTHGSGTPDDPYLIESAENLAWLAQSVNERQNILAEPYTSPGGVFFYEYTFLDVTVYADTCFKLVIDLDLGKGNNCRWLPIGAYRVFENLPYFWNDSYTTYFCGNFDGDNHVIENMWLTPTSFLQNEYPGYFGLFGVVQGATIANIQIDNLLASVLLQFGQKELGGVAGLAINSDFRNCHLSGSLRLGGYSCDAGPYLGGIIAHDINSSVEDCSVHADLHSYCAEAVGGIIGVLFINGNKRVSNCSYVGAIDELSRDAGGIVGYCTRNSGTVSLGFEHCYSRGSLTRGVLPGEGTMQIKNTKLGGIVGRSNNISTLAFDYCYSNDTLVGHASAGTGVSASAGGIVGKVDGSTVIRVTNSYHAGPVTSLYCGGIMPSTNITHTVLNSYFEADCCPSNGIGQPKGTDEMKTKSFVNLLNRDSIVYVLDRMPFQNGGYPVFFGPESLLNQTEWYYEILNEDGSITYQHLEYTSDTTVNSHRAKVVVRTNKIYDKEEHVEVSHEYLYEEDEVVYWWNKELQEFTTLYNFAANPGDEWEIKVGSQTLVMHVDEVYSADFDGTAYRVMQVSDPDDLFSGEIICGIGHTTSFFPERLMSKTDPFLVDGLRCYWLDGELVLKFGDDDCDAIYQGFHSLPEIPIPHSASRIPHFTLYPNPTPRNTVITLSRNNVNNANNVPSSSFLITSPLGQPLLTGPILSNPFQIDLSSLPKGLYFITIGNQTQKLIIGNP